MPIPTGRDGAVDMSNVTQGHDGQFQFQDGPTPTPSVSRSGDNGPPGPPRPRPRATVLQQPPAEHGVNSAELSRSLERVRVRVQRKSSQMLPDSNNQAPAPRPPSRGESMTVITGEEADKLDTDEPTPGGWRGTVRGWWKKLEKHLNFFRIHLTVFTLTPLVFACIFYAANGSASGNANSTNTGRQKVTFIDSLFLCFSAMTLTGLATINLSACGALQQVLLFILFIMGDVTVVGLVMVVARKRYFRRHCLQLLRNDHFKRTNTVLPLTAGVLDRVLTLKARAAAAARRVKVHKGDISPPRSPRLARAYTDEKPHRQDALPLAPVNASSGTSTTLRDSQTDPTDHRDTGLQLITSHDPHAVRFTDSPVATTLDIHSQHSPSEAAFPRTTSIQNQQYLARQRLRTRGRTLSMSSGANADSHHDTLPPMYRNAAHPRPPYPPHHFHSPQGGELGGFEIPFNFFARLLLPENTRRAMHKKMTMPARQHTILTHDTHTLQRYDRFDEQDNDSEEKGHWGMRTRLSRWMPESLSSLVVGRNSRFFSEELDDEDLERIGGVEYRALRLLSYFVFFYIFIFMVIPFALLAIYFACVKSFDSAFQEKQGIQDQTIDKTWFALFLAVSAYTGCGMSLTDQSLSPFGHCYMLVAMICIGMLAGNHAMPMTLRLFIWLGTKVWRKGETHETLHFLLDHPRRCFLYLFPSHQTWYLVLALVAFTALELFGYLVLNIDLPVLSGIGGWQRFSDAIVQSFSVRASGFGVISITSLAPSVLFLYIILMYVAIYPIAMSVRSTNVYEERALGVYEAADPELTTDNEPAYKGARHEVFSKYLMWHVRRQLAFDIWPLALSIFLILIIERGKILDPDRSDWFDIFRVIFECTSAYATIGLSLGTPNNNYSFAGELSTLSKFILILVMLRGRHRGLPVAIDRAILLPKEYARIDKRGDQGQDVDQVFTTPEGTHVLSRGSTRPRVQPIATHP